MLDARRRPSRTGDVAGTEDGLPMRADPPSPPGIALAGRPEAIGVLRVVPSASATSTLTGATSSERDEGCVAARRP